VNVSQSFRDRADSAALFEAYVASALTREGLYVLCHPWAIDGKDHGQSYDLEVSRRHPNNSSEYDFWSPVTTVEVKSLNRAFTGPYDYPFKDILVCSLSSWQKKWPGTAATQRDFLFISRVSGAIIWLPNGSETSVTEVEDKSRLGYIQKTMTSPSSCLKSFKSFVEQVKANG
jgi:hypothetical protein